MCVSFTIIFSKQGVRSHTSCNDSHFNFDDFRQLKYQDYFLKVLRSVFSLKELTNVHDL